MKKIPIRNILMVLGGLGLVALIVYVMMPKPAPVDMVVVARGPLLVTVDEDGKTRIKKWSPYKNGHYYPRNPFRYVISAPLDGDLLQIQLEPGDKVDSNKIVAVLRPGVPALLNKRTRAELEAKEAAATKLLKKAEAMKRKAEAAYTLAKKQFLRDVKLLADEAISLDTFDVSKNNEQLKQEEVSVSKAAVEVARYELKVAQAVLKTYNKARKGESLNDFRFEIPTPLGGTVLRVYAEYSGPVSSGAKLLEIGDLGELEVVIDVLSEDAVRIKKGAKVFLEQWGGDFPLLGRVWRVEPQGVLKISALGVEEQRANVIIHFDEVANRKRDKANVRKRLGDAYRVQARIVVWEGPDVVKVPAGALFRQNKKWAVFIVADGHAQVRHVLVGHSSGTESEILSGLKVGDRVILHPSDRVKDGVQVYAR